MIQMEVVKAAVKKLVSMLNPAGAVIQAIIAIYNTVTFFIEKIKPDRRRGRLVHRLDRGDRRRPGRRRRQARRADDGQHADRGDRLPRQVRRSRRHPRQARRDRQEDPRSRSTRASTRSSTGSARCSTSSVTAAKDTAKKLLEWWRKKVPDHGWRRAAHADVPGRAQGGPARRAVRSRPIPSVFVTRRPTRRRHQGGGQHGTDRQDARVHAQKIKALQRRARRSSTTTKQPRRAVRKPRPPTPRRSHSTASSTELGDARRRRRSRRGR